MSSSMSMVQFMAHIAHVNHNLTHVATHAFEHVAQIVEDEAKREIGNYQAAAGPFAAWAELADSTKDDRVKHGFTENDPGLRTGEMRDSIHHASDHTGAVVGSDNEKLKFFELGTSKQPPRSILGTAVIHKEHEITHTLGSAYHAALLGKSVIGGAFKIK